MEIRQAMKQDAEAIAKVHVDAWRTTYRGLVPQDYLNRLSYEERTDRWNRILSGEPIVYVAANEAGQIVGFANGGKERSEHPIYNSELYAIYILEQYQRMGIGRQLAVSVMESLAREGYRAMLIWVLEQNPSRAFYEHLGGIPLHSQTIDIGGARLQEIAYGFHIG